MRHLSPCHLVTRSPCHLLLPKVNRKSKASGTTHSDDPARVGRTPRPDATLPSHFLATPAVAQPRRAFFLQFRSPPESGVDYNIATMRNRISRAFTVIELLVVIGIMA